jgi:hypothetical protein
MRVRVREVQHSFIVAAALFCFSTVAIAQSNITRNGNNVTVTCDGNFTPLQTLCQNGNACNAIGNQNLINPPAAGNSGQDNVSFSTVPATVEWKVTNVNLSVNTGPPNNPNIQDNADPALVSISNDPGGAFELEEADGTVTKGPIATAANPVHIQISRNVTQNNGDAQGDFALVQYQVKCTAVPAGTDGLTIDKTANPTTFTQVGDIITYSYKVTNTGTTTINNITVTDNKLAAAAIHCPVTNDNTIPTLLSGASLTCTAQYTIIQADLTQCSVTNEGTATGTGNAQIIAKDTETVTCQPPANDGLTLDKTATPNTFTQVGDVITYSYTVTNTGTTTINNITVTDDKVNAADIHCPGTNDNTIPTLAANSPPVVCTAQYTITQADLIQCSVTNEGTATGTGNAQVTAKDTETVKAQLCGSKDRTETLIHGFLKRRVDLLASNEPDRPRLMRRFNASPTSSANGSGPMMIVGSSESGQYSFGTSLGQMRAAAAQKKYDEVQRMSLGATSGPGYVAPSYGQTSAVDVWMEGHFQQFDDELGGADQDGDFGILYVGADYLVSRSVLVGVLVQFDWMDQQTQSLNADLSGRGWMAGPYASFQLSPNIYFDARGAWGESDNDISPFGTYTDSFDTERWLAKANFTGNWNIGSVYVSPSVGVIYVDERSESYVDSLGNSIFSQSVRLGRLTFGPEFRYPIHTKDGAILEPHVSFTGMWDFDKEDNNVANVGGLLVGDQDFRVKTEAGLLVHTPDISDASFRATVSYDGIGDDDFSAWGGQLWVNWPLN